MGVQNIKSYGSGLFLGAIFFIHGMMVKRLNIMNDVFANYFIDPTDKTNWQNIESVFEPHITQNLNPSGSTPSKPPRQIDGGFQPITASKLGSDYAQMYDQANSLGLLLNPDAMVYYFDETIDPIQNIEATMKWDMLMTSYVVLKNMEDVVGLVFEAIKPLYKSTSFKYMTPAQLWFHIDDYMHGTLSQADTLIFIPWTTIDQFRTDNDSNLGIVDVILRHSFRDLWYINIPTITFGASSDSFNVSGGSFAVLSPPSGLPYAVSSTFISEPVAPGDSLATCSFGVEYFNARVIKYNLTLNDAAGGTITSTYKTLLVS